MTQPTAYRWKAPQEFTDGVAIPADNPLDYEIGDDTDGDGVFEAVFTVVGNLQTQVSPMYYDAPVGQMEFDPGIHRLAIRAVNNEVSPAGVSGWSNVEQFTITAGQPNPPFDFSVEF